MKEMLLNFLQKTGKDHEFKLFLKLFQGIPKMKFAVIKISGQTIKNHLDVIAQDIAYLHSLGIYPLVVHGAGSALDKKLPHSKKRDGVRVTSKEDIPVIKEVFTSIAQNLANNVIMNGGDAAVVEGVFSCEQVADYGFVGKVSGVNLSKIKKVIDEGKTPIISPIGMSEVGELNINADTAAKELVSVIGPKKFILMTETGGILGEDGEIVPYLNLSSADFSHISGGMLHKVKELKEFLSTIKGVAVVITSAQNLLKEMFTIKGSGTYIKYHTLNFSSEFEPLNTEKITLLIEHAFGKKLKKGYFESSVKEVIYQEDYEGIAIIKEVNGVAYLDKFVVDESLQGTGLGLSLWNEVIGKYPTMMWRSRSQNPFNGFYMKNCDGMVKGEEWFVFWKGLDSSQASDHVKEIAQLAPTVV